MIELELEPEHEQHIERGREGQTDDQRSGRFEVSGQCEERRGEQENGNERAE